MAFKFHGTKEERAEMCKDIMLPGGSLGWGLGLWLGLRLGLGLRVKGLRVNG